MATLVLKTLPKDELFGEEDVPFDETKFPTKGEVAAIEDHGLLWEMMDDYEAAIIRIETALRFTGGQHEDRDWFFRARSALIGFRIALSRVERRARQLMKNRPGPSVESVAPEV